MKKKKKKEAGSVDSTTALPETSSKTSSEVVRLSCGGFGRVALDVYAHLCSFLFVHEHKLLAASCRALRSRDALPSVWYSVIFHPKFKPSFPHFCGVISDEDPDLYPLELLSSRHLTRGPGPDHGPQQQDSLAEIDTEVAVAAAHQVSQTESEEKKDATAFGVLTFPAAAVAAMARCVRLTRRLEAHVGISPLGRVHERSFLRHFQSLRWLYIADELLSLKPLRGCPLLEHLKVTIVPSIDCLLPLSGLTALWSIELSAYEDQVTVDLSPLSALTALEKLIVNFPTANAETLSLLTKLEVLQLSYADWDNIRPLSTLAALKEFAYMSNYEQTLGIDLSPLSSLTTLECLDLCHTFVAGSDLSPLSTLTGLESLLLISTGASDVSPLSFLTALLELNLSDNPILADVSTLSTLVSLRFLDLSLTAVADVSPLSTLSLLEVLLLHSTEVQNISSLSSMISLRTLGLGNLPVTDISPLSTLTALQELIMYGATLVTDVSPLSFLKALQKLDLSAVQVAEISPLSTLRALRSVNLEMTQVADASPLSQLRALRGLSLGRTPVADASPLAGLTALQQLQLGHTQVADVSPLSTLLNLEKLGLIETPVADVSPLSTLSALKHLALDKGFAEDKSCLSSLVDNGLELRTDEFLIFLR